MQNWAFWYAKGLLAARCWCTTHTCSQVSLEKGQANNSCHWSSSKSRLFEVNDRHRLPSESLFSVKWNKAAQRDVWAPGAACTLWLKMTQSAHKETDRFVSGLVGRCWSRDEKEMETRAEGGKFQKHHVHGWECQGSSIPAPTDKNYFTNPLQIWTALPDTERVTPSGRIAQGDGQLTAAWEVGGSSLLWKLQSQDKKQREVSETQMQVHQD